MFPGIASGGKVFEKYLFSLNIDLQSRFSNFKEQILLTRSKDIRIQQNNLPPGHNSESSQQFP